MEPTKQTPELSQILKEMWRLDEKDKRGEKFNYEEKKYWEKHLDTIMDYYFHQNHYWFFNMLKNQN